MAKPTDRDRYAAVAAVGPFIRHGTISETEELRRRVMHAIAAAREEGRLEGIKQGHDANADASD